MSSAESPNCSKQGRAGPQSVSSNDPDDKNASLCEEMLSRIHGYGLFSTQQIERGTLILSEKPLVSIPAAESSSAAIWKAFRELDEDGQQDWMKLCHRPNFYRESELAQKADEKTLVDQCGKVLAKYAANARDDCVTGNRILPRRVARLNHSCVPNALWVLNPHSGCIEVRALTVIRTDAEIFVSYINQVQSRQFRQERLLDWKFICNCRLCHDDASEDEELYGELQLIDAKIVHLPSTQVDKLEALIALYSKRLDLERRSRCLAWDTVVSAIAMNFLCELHGQPEDAVRAEHILQEHLAICYGKGFVLPDDMRHGILRGALPGIQLG